MFIYSSFSYTLHVHILFIFIYSSFSYTLYFHILFIFIYSSFSYTLHFHILNSSYKIPSLLKRVFDKFPSIKTDWFLLINIIFPQMKYYKAEAFVLFGWVVFCYTFSSLVGSQFYIIYFCCRKI